MTSKLDPDPQSEMDPPPIPAAADCSKFPSPPPPSLPALGRAKATGLEVNSGWWESGYSTPHFIPLVYTEPGVVPELPTRRLRQ